MRALCPMLSNIAEITRKGSFLGVNNLRDELIHFWHLTRMERQLKYIEFYIEFGGNGWSCSRALRKSIDDRLSAVCGNVCFPKHWHHVIQYDGSSLVGCTPSVTWNFKDIHISVPHSKKRLSTAVYSVYYLRLWRDAVYVFGLAIQHLNDCSRHSTLLKH